MAFINNFILNLITVLHIIVVLFIILAPFSNSNYLLFLHAVFVPFIIFHWLINNNTCSLTIAEKYIREQTYGVKADVNDCFSYKFIAPIYDFNKNYKEYSAFTYMTTILLWAISVYNLSYKYKNGEINKFHDLLKIY